MNYRADMVSLRAIAVILVVLYHAGVEIFPGGFVGVDVFFVISGFLMTRIIAAAFDNNSFSLPSFYGGRLRRVFPALFVCAALSLPLVFLYLIYFGRYFELDHAIRYTILGVSNFYFYRHLGYFDIAANLQAFLHTWSLSLEMQFYLFYALVLSGSRKFFKMPFHYVLAFLGFLSLLLSVYLLDYDPEAAFYYAAAAPVGIFGWRGFSLETLDAGRPIRETGVCGDRRNADCRLGLPLQRPFEFAISRAICFATRRITSIKSWGCRRKAILAETGKY
jgi:peptidoglycan/LPS O-acetylase OafA/YrhL